jgi:3-dehydroquinate dehydratase-2
MARILLLSGPNLSILGVREPEVYGTETLAEYVERARLKAAAHGHVMDHLQSDHEGELVKAVNEAAGRYEAVVVNAGALTHYSYALADALAAYPGVAVELHITNPAAREPHRHVSVIAPYVDGTISGFGILGYELAVEAVSALLGRESAQAEGNGASRG